MVSSKSFTVLAQTFRAVVHFELIFVCGMKLGNFPGFVVG